MRAETNVGILGIGVYLPEEVRTNDWWPKEVVDKWRVRADASAIRAHKADPRAASEGVMQVEAAMAEFAHDPFQGTRERRIIANGQTSLDMEVAAARAAIRNADIDSSDIDTVLSFALPPAEIGTNNACAVHKALGLRPDVFALQTEGICNSFLAQLTLARSMIVSGESKCALLVFSSSISTTLPWDEPFSAWFGDAAAAVVVGPVAAEFGILGTAHGTDGDYHRTLLFGAEGSDNWADGGKIITVARDKRKGTEMILGVAERGKGVLDRALERAGLSTDDVDFYASHQATAWFRRVTQAYAGFHRARFRDTFEETASLSAANIPLQLYHALGDGVLHTGDVIAMYAGGTGISWSAVTMRWGTRA